jgi:3-deoxy-D-manno-octulosonate 8-phosphate phosphatase (KDO 8-P phosphatase)
MWFNADVTKPSDLVLDLDGVLTDGKFLYSKAGKSFKAFSVDDHDGIKLVQNFLDVHIISADSSGFEISKRRVVKDMNLSLTLVSIEDRLDWIRRNFGLDNTIYMGDGIFDKAIFQRVYYAIAPSSALKEVRRAADFVTIAKGGERSVAEACLHIAKRFFGLRL